jgi:hypothetical protein
MIAIEDRQRQVEERTKDLKKIKKKIEAREEELLKFEINLKNKDQALAYKQKQTTQFAEKIENVLKEIDGLRSSENKLQRLCQQSLDNLSLLSVSLEKQLEKSTLEHSQYFTHLVKTSQELLRRTCHELVTANTRASDAISQKIVNTIQKETSVLKHELSLQVGSYCKELATTHEQGIEKKTADILKSIQLTESTITQRLIQQSDKQSLKNENIEKNIHKQAELFLTTTKEITRQGQKDTKNLANLIVSRSRSIEEKIQAPSIDQITSVINSSLSPLATKNDQMKIANSSLRRLDKIEKDSGQFTQTIISKIEAIEHKILQEINRKHENEMRLNQIASTIEKKLSDLENQQKILGEKERNLQSVVQDISRKNVALGRQVIRLQSKEKELSILQEKIAQKEHLLKNQTMQLAKKDSEMKMREKKLADAFSIIQGQVPGSVVRVNKSTPLDN